MRKTSDHRAGVRFSLEFFPPRSDAALERLSKVLPRLPKMNPDFITVTFKPGSENYKKTLNAILWIKKHTGLVPASHLTYIGLSKQDIHRYVKTLRDKGIRHIVALRGDIPEGFIAEDYRSEDYYQYTSDFVHDLKRHFDVEISVAAYPEKHPDAPSLEDDIEALKKKCDAGATRAITQFFFENSSYYDFLDKTERAGIKTPIVPGLLPIANFEKTLRFAKSCQANVPEWICKKYEDGRDDPESLEKISEELLVNQCEDLMANGVRHIHFYTLNHGHLLTRVARTLGLYMP